MENTLGMTKYKKSIEFNLNHPTLKGHFPGNPVIPGAVILEHVLTFVKEYQKGEIICIGRAKFMNPLIPPAMITIELDQKNDSDFDFKVSEHDKVISQGILKVESEA